MLNKILLPKQINSFLDYMEKNRNKSIKTIESYGADLHMFIAYLKMSKANKNITIDTELTKMNITRTSDNFYKSITSNDINNFIGYLDSRGNAASSKNRRIMAIKSFFKYLVKVLKIIQEDISTDIETLNLPDKEMCYLKSEEMNKILEVVKNSDAHHSVRDYAIMILFMNTGMRNSELREIKLSDINWGINKMTVLGKGNKQRILYSDDKVIEALHKWLKEREDIKIKEEYEDYLFVSQQGRVIEINTMNKIVKKYVEEAGFDPKKIHTHTLRHSALTNILKKTKNVKLTQKISGHKSAKTLLDIYAHIDDEELQNAMNNLGIG